MKFSLCVALALLSTRALAQDTVPSAGDEAKRAARERKDDERSSAYPVHAWELPPVKVEGERKPELREEERVGDYAQPRWTATRRFPTTRVYVVPAGKMEFEWWFKAVSPLDDPVDGHSIETRYEWEMGLGHHLQLDLYLVGSQGAGYEAFSMNKEKIEVRWALADYGAIWGNPTLYVEWTHENGKDDALEGKVLLGGELAPKWHGGLNLVFERGLGGEKANVYEVTAGISYTLVDETLSLGLEGKAELEDLDGARGAFAQTYVAGPSLSWSPVPPARILFVPMFGLERSSDGKNTAIFEPLLVAGWTF